MLINSFSMVTPFSNVFPALNLLHISTSIDFSYLLCNSFETVTVGYMSVLEQLLQSLRHFLFT